MSKKDKRSMDIKRAKKQQQKEIERRMKKRDTGNKAPTVTVPAGISGLSEEDFNAEKIQGLLLESPRLIESQQFDNFRFDTMLAIQHTADVSKKYHLELETSEPSDEIMIKCYSEIIGRLLTKDIKKDLKKRLHKYAEYHAKKGNQNEVMIAAVAEGSLSDKAIPLGANPLLIHLYKLSVENIAKEYQKEGGQESEISPLHKEIKMPMAKEKTKKPSIFKRLVGAIKKARAGD